METLAPIQKQSLSDNLAQRIKQFIIHHNYKVDDRLPTTAELAKRFGVGQPTIREALKKLETVGVVKVKHGSGIYVGEQVNHLFLPNPIISDEPPTKKMLLDLIEAKIPIEVKAISEATVNATDENIERLRKLLIKGQQNPENDDLLHEINVSFHKEIAIASGNYLLVQIIDVLSAIYKNEQRYLIDNYLSKANDLAQHQQIFEAIASRDSEKAAQLMYDHLAEFRDSIKHWEPDKLTNKTNGAYYQIP